VRAAASNAPAFIFHFSSLVAHAAGTRLQAISIA
jgi:hypothetical protein